MHTLYLITTITELTRHPIPASTPGAGLPENLPLKPYRRERTEAVPRPSNVTSSELLLHSSAHPKIDFTAREGEEVADPYLSHYLGVFDPESGELQLVEVPSVNVRGNVRQAAPEREDDSEAEEPVEVCFGDFVRQSLRGFQLDIWTYANTFLSTTDGQPFAKECSNPRLWNETISQDGAVCS